MSKLVDDVKSGLKGIRGAGDALRGEMLEATDNAFEKDTNNPQTIAKHEENRRLEQKGRNDMRGADEMIARREREHQGGVPLGSEGSTHSQSQVASTKDSTTDSRGLGGTGQASSHAARRDLATEQPSAPGGPDAPPAPGTMSGLVRKGPLLGNSRH